MGWKKEKPMITHEDKLDYAQRFDGLMNQYLFGDKRKNADTLIKEGYLRVDDAGVLRQYKKIKNTRKSKKVDL